MAKNGECGVHLDQGFIDIGDMQVMGLGKWGSKTKLPVTYVLNVCRAELQTPEIVAETQQWGSDHFVY